MTVEKYLPTTFSGKLIRLSEECAEVIQAICKIQRFGIDNQHPVTKETNRDQLLRELNDLRVAIEYVAGVEEYKR